MTIPLYEKSEAYTIAEKFNVKYSEMPCIAFFKAMESGELIIYKLDNTSSENSITDELRAIFDTIRINREDGVPFESWREHRWNELKNFMKRKRRERRNARIINGFKTAGGIVKDVSVAIGAAYPR